MSGIKTKLWVGVGAFVLAGSQMDVPATGGMPDVSFTKAFASNVHGHAAHGQKEGGEGGEGGESGKKNLNASERKIHFLKNLTLVEGHLTAGYELYKAGAKDAAKTHMKHPGDELYGVLKPGFKEFNAPSFDASLKKMALAVEQGKSPEEVEKAYQAVVADIDRARDQVQPSLKTRLLTVSSVIRVAGLEFDEAVKDGKVVNAHEYQDAYGFVKTGTRLLNSAEPKSPEQKMAVEQASEALKKFEGAWPTLTGEGQLKTTSSELYGAAGKIQLEASSLK